MLTTSSKTERPIIEIYTKVVDIRVRDFQTEIAARADLEFQAKGPKYKEKKKGIHIVLTNHQLR